MTDATAAVSPLRRRMIDDMSLRNLSPATQQSYPLRCCEVQPKSRPIARSARYRGRACIPGLPRIAGHLLARPQPDGVRTPLLLRCDDEPGGGAGTDRLRSDASQIAGDPEC